MSRTQEALAVLRPDVREFTASVDAAVLRPADESVLSRADRARIALRVALVNEHAEYADELAEQLDSLAGEGAADVIRDVERWSELSESLQALLAHCEQVALDPVDAGFDEIAALRAHGFSSAEVVAASQVVAYVSYRVRLLLGLRLIEQADDGPVPPEPAYSIAVGATADGCELPTPAEAFPVLRWVPWVDPATAPEKSAGADEKRSPFYLTLLHDPQVLAERTALYNAIMTGTGALDRADRELAALATSLITGCEYCAGVHGRRQVQLSKDQVTSVALAKAGPAAVADPRQRAIVDAAGALAPTPAALADTDIRRLRAVGLSLDDIRDLVAVSAMFAWANRLMLTLGNPAA
ncbi:peroxidase-related enzyme [Saccharopolyspora phatthalungensis]|uniref:Putative peroxidase-related enzyme n=1 Tax=Saccharopolyspora phatthalungensis TaxID=664693 RepID=A0A840Q5S8_9PSEU|nr:peroxidase-related enzyme [Saccharopolyspora phatthalungensis]MBB5153735.1 putative peroxidase-related enzyme [Saccharopolyspora phatthalungensis]